MKIDWITVVKCRYARDWGNPVLDKWLNALAAMGAVVRASSVAPRVDLMRNREVGRWLAEDATRYLLMVDSDMVPLPETNALLVEAGDALWCPYVDQAGKVIDAQKNGVGTGCMRISRGLAEAIPEPRFEYTLDTSGRKVEKSEAFTFTQKVAAAGFAFRAVGRAGHLMRLVALPPGPGHTAVEWKFEWEFWG
ncbi:MAG TPA: hypothetical protein VM219_09090 [Phycisphaerae bacterium]|nr:hypothetical protein [Phycisphaerae bacterium]HUX02977.1 hypothetical protein [Phycisphaerae bacterium]